MTTDSMVKWLIILICLGGLVQAGAIIWGNEELIRALNNDPMSNLID